MRANLNPYTGASRGFAFVEFQNIADAQRWMDLNQVVKHRRSAQLGSAQLHRALWMMMQIVM